MTVPVDYQVANSFFGLGKETTYDTPIVPGFWIPMSQPKWSPKTKWLPDKSLVGSPAVTRDLVPGVRYDEFSFKHNLYLDSVGNMLVGLLGTDTVTGTGPYLHTVKLINNYATGSQPPSYTLDYFDSSQARQIAGSRFASWHLTFGAEVECSAVASFAGNIETDISFPTQTPSTASFVPGWSSSITIGGVASTVLVSGELDIDRGTGPIFTATGAQGPHLIFTGPIQVKGKAKCLVESSAVNFFGATSFTRDQQAVVLSFTDPVSADVLTFTMTNCQFMDPVLDPSKKWLQVDVNFEGVADTTDASSGISPLQASILCAQSTAF